jgi:hypothetical protein
LRQGLSVAVKLLLTCPLREQLVTLAPDPDDVVCVELVLSDVPAPGDLQATVIMRWLPSALARPQRNMPATLDCS